LALEGRSIASVQDHAGRSATLADKFLPVYHHLEVMEMYEAMDSFLNIPTWHTKHAADQERFFCALRSIVKNPGFNADMMGGHMRQFILARHGSNPHYDEVIRYYVAAAWAVSRYLSAKCE
jgi:hypothetical protein